MVVGLPGALGVVTAGGRYSKPGVVALTVVVLTGTVAGRAVVGAGREVVGAVRGVVGAGRVVVGAGRVVVGAGRGVVLMGTVGAGPQLGPTGTQLLPTQLGSVWQGPRVGRRVVTGALVVVAATGGR